MAAADPTIPNAVPQYETFESLESAARKYLVELITRPLHLILIGLFIGPLLGMSAFYAVRNVQSLKESRATQASAISGLYAHVSTNEKDIAATTSAIRKMATITAASTSGIVLRLDGIDGKLTAVQGKLTTVQGDQTAVRGEIAKLKARQDAVEAAVVGRK